VRARRSDLDAHELSYFLDRAASRRRRDGVERVVLSKSNNRLRTPWALSFSARLAGVSLTCSAAGWASWKPAVSSTFSAGAGVGVWKAGGVVTGASALGALLHAGRVAQQRTTIDTRNRRETP
jgi:hypothetical protein